MTRKVTLKHWRKARLSPPLGCGPGLRAGNWHSSMVPGVPRAWSRNAHAFPSTHRLSSPQDISQDEGCAPASKQQSHSPAWLEPALGSSAATGSARLLRCCPSPPAQHHPRGRQAPGKCGTGPWGRSLTSCRQCCSVWVPFLPTHLLPVLATEQHRSPGNTWPSVGGRGQGGQGPWPPTLAPCFQHHRCSHSECRTERSLRHSTAQSEDGAL